MTDAGEEALKDAYRSPQSLDGPRVRAESELRYFPERPRMRSSIALYGVFAPLFAFATVAGLSGSAGLGLLALAATVGWFTWKRRRDKLVPRAVLTIDGASLVLSGEAFAPPVTLRLEELLEVYLDTTTIQRVQENAGPVPDLRFLNATVGGAQDLARIGLELENETLFLTDERVSHLDATEWFRKLRRFLRQHGWVPEDER